MKQRKTTFTRHSRLCRALIPTAVMVAASPLVLADDNGGEDRFHFDGYLREEVSINAKNWQDTPAYNDQGKVSMARTTVRVNMDFKVSDAVTVVAKGRAAREINTPFLKHLKSMGGNSYRGKNLTDLYNDVDLREWYADIKASDRVKFRIGKQQIVWGETDFFVANDLAQGYDNVWRSFLEPANEELRKGNIILKTNIDVPEANGGIEAFLRPGWDRKRDIGTEIDVYGGRWSSQPYAGVDFRNIDPYAWHNAKADIDRKTGGVRWSGMAGDTNYSVSWMRTFYNAPIMNPSPTTPSFLLGIPGVGASSGVTPTGSTTTAGSAGEIIYPIVNVFGATASRYADMADAVFSTEVAFIKNAPFNVVAATSSPMSQFIAPGFDGWKTKNVVAAMVRMDKNFAFTQNLLGTEKPMFFSVQLFDKWIQKFDQNDNLLYSVGWGGRAKRHNTLVTTIFDLSYDNGRIHPQLVLGADVTNGGGFYIPSLTTQLSKNVRWKVEYDGFWDNGYAKTVNGGVPASDRTTLFGYLHHRDQIYTSLTYQF